jgi:putative thioredoxin
MFSPDLTPVPAPASDDAVRDVTLASFKQDVLEASKTCLVLLDFWATWCGPCKQLTPVLEKIARGSKGTVKLAKIDIDQNQQIAQQMGVQSVPSVFAFFQGKPIDGFAGALPEAQIRQWLDQLMQGTGAGGDEKAGLDTALKQAADFFAAKDIATAHAIYADIHEMAPDNAAAYAGLIRCVIEEGKITHAQELFDAAPEAIQKDKAFEPVRAALELAAQAGDANQIGELQVKIAVNENDHQARFDLAMALYGAGKREEAVDQLLDLVRRGRSWNEEAARKQLVKFFEAMGAMDPLTIAARRRLSSLLFS